MRLSAATGRCPNAACVASSICSIRFGSWSWASMISSTVVRSKLAKCSKTWSGTVRPDRRSADSSRRSPYVSGGPQWTWKRPFVSMPPMSMHSIGQAWAHWKQVSHFRPPYSSYRSWSRPRNFAATSAGISGYMTVAFGWKNRRRVKAMPLTSPKPGTRPLIRPTARAPEGSSSGAALQPVDDEDGQRGHEQIQQRGRQQPFPGEAHELVDPDTGQRPAHPHEHEHERERLAQEPEQARDPVEVDVRPQAGEPADDEVEQDEADDQRDPPPGLAAEQVDRRCEQEGPDHRHEHDQEQEPDAELARIDHPLDMRDGERRVPAAEEEHDGDRRD